MSRFAIWLSMLSAGIVTASVGATEPSRRNTVRQYVEGFAQPYHVTYYHPGYYEPVPGVGLFAATYHHGSYHSPVGIYGVPVPYPYPGHFAEPFPNFNASYGPVGPWVLRPGPAAMIAPAAVVPLGE